MITTTAHIEMTDTFNGQANYCWIKQETFDVDIDTTTQRQVERRARALVGLTGVRCTRSDYGDREVRWDVQGANICAFLTYDWD